MGRIFCIMGKSASGKDTLFKELLRAKPALKTVVSYTTRPIRAGEADGREYFFVHEDDLEQMEADGRVIECRRYHTKHGIWAYFTADDGQIDLERADYLVIGTLVSYASLRAYYGDEALVPIYVETEDGLRLSRALARERAQAEPKYAEMCRRFLADEEDFSEEKLEAAGITKRYVNRNSAETAADILEELQLYPADHG